MKRILITISPEQNDEVNALAKKKSWTKSQLVTEAIYEYLKKEKKEEEK